MGESLFYFLNYIKKYDRDFNPLKNCAFGATIRMAAVWASFAQLGLM
jgi:hypothetical protein